MSERPKFQPKETARHSEEERTERRLQIAFLIRELSKIESIPFFGILPDVFKQLEADDEYSEGYVTPIGKLLRRCTLEGIKVVSSDAHSTSGNAFILPAGSDDRVMDSIQIESLMVHDNIPPMLKQLIRLKPPHNLF